MFRWQQVAVRVGSRLRMAAVVAVAMACTAGRVEACPFTCGDIDGDGMIGAADYAAFSACLGEAPESTPACTCSDLDGSGSIDLRDFVLFQPVYALVTDEIPPACSGAVRSLANLTAYRPQHGVGYAPFARTAVAEADEESETHGPGIRVNGSGDIDTAGEDDLIEVVVTVDPPGGAFVLRRDTDALHVWTTRTRAAGTDISFSGGATGVLPIGPGVSQIVLWVEWADTAHGTGRLSIHAAGSEVAKDTLVFHTFVSAVIALGGEGQVPTDPPDANLGTFVVAVGLYRAGYDVHMYDEDDVSSGGAGRTYNEVVTAIQHRAVGPLAIFGYSHGGGSTHDLAQRLDANRASIGVFSIVFTSYVDAVRNNSDVDTAQELRRPPASAYHLNHFQVGSLFQDLGLDGGPVPNSNPPPTGLNVETVFWGSTSTHFEVDDFVQVRDAIVDDLTARTAR